MLLILCLQWWPATLSRVSEDGKTDGEGRVAYILRYDPDAEFGYEEATEHTVSFLDEHELFDFGLPGTMLWRHAGSDWDRVENPETTENGVTIINLRDLSDEGERINR